jgi:hypothetical protein
MSRSISPIFRRTLDGSNSSRALLNTDASGKLAAYVPVAMGHRSIAPTKVAPADRAPALLRPAPQNRSKARNDPSLICKNKKRRDDARFQVVMHLLAVYKEAA